MEKGLYQNLRKFISVIDNLRDVGLQKHIKLPRIVTLGTQSSGKSSLLESIVGMDFLPRGEGVCTRRPLELRLVHVQETSSHSPPYGEFEAIPNKKITNFDEIKRTIEMLTDKVAGTKKGIIDDPIVLTIHSEACPDLTLVDLPGITRIPLKDSDQPENIEEITMQMAHRYVSDERTIILCVIPANQDLSTSDSLKMARTIDPKGLRTLGVLTKIDIMDQGTNARNILANKEVPLKLGYVGVKNRNQQDIKDNKKVSQALKDEKLYFSKHPVYSTLPPGYLGTEVLTNKLSNQLFDHIRKHLPDIMKEMNIKLEECQERLRLLGPALPHNDAEKTQLIWDIVTRFSLQFRNSIEGKYSTDANLSLSQPEGAKIRIMFNDIFQEFLPENFSASKEYDDNNISKAIKKHEGDSLPGFYGQDAFLYLLDPILDRLKEPSQECVNEIFILLEKMSNELLSKECQRFPTLLSEMQERVVKILDIEREKTKAIVDDVIDSEIGYLFTSDQSFFKSFFETAELAPKPGQRQQQQQQIQPEILTEEKVRNLIIKEMRNKIDIYFKIIVRNLRDRIPKTIGYFFIKKLQETIQLSLIAELNNDDELKESLKEQNDVKEERERLQSTIQVLKNSQKIMKRDPDLQAFIYASKMNENNEEQQEQQEQQQSSHHQHSISGGPSQPQQSPAPQKQSNPNTNQQLPRQQTQQQAQPISAARTQQPINQAQQFQNQAQPPAQQHLIQQSSSGKTLQSQQQQQQQLLMQQQQQQQQQKSQMPQNQQTATSTTTSTPKTQPQQPQNLPQQQPQQQPQTQPQANQMNTQQLQQQQMALQQQQAQQAAAAAAAKKPNFFQQGGATDQKNPLGSAAGISPSQAQQQQQQAQVQKADDKKKDQKKGKGNLFG